MIPLQPTRELPMRIQPAVPMHEAPITDILNQWQAGSRAAGNQLLPLIYRELRKIAAHHLRLERAGHTLQPTALVHESFLRLHGRRAVRWESRLQFMAYSARLMRQILVDHARCRRRIKRGGDAVMVSFDHHADALAGFVETYPGLIALDDALRDLASWDVDKAEVVELRFFGGLTTTEIAGVTKVSTATVERRWRSARAWLYRQLEALAR